MADLMKMLNVFLEFIKEEYSQDVAIVAYYGSYANGTQHSKSDLDLFFIPSNKRGNELSNCIIYEGIGIDFFSIPWDRAERIANYEESFTSIIADCKLLYYKSEKDRKRFLSLQKTIKSYQKPEKKEKMLYKAKESLEKAYKPIFLINQSKNITEIRNEAFHAIVSILQTILFINQTYPKSGWGKNFNQIFSLPIKPNNLESLVNKIVFSGSKEEISYSLKVLIDKTDELIKSEIHKIIKVKTFNEVFNNFYEELKSTILKILSACSRNQPYIAFCATISLQDEVRWCLQQIGDKWIENKFFDLEPIKFYDPSNLSLLNKAVEEYDKELVNLLGKYNIKIKRINNLKNFKRFLYEKE